MEDDPIERMLAHLQSLVPDDWPCVLCGDDVPDVDGCAACIKGVRPDVVDAIYEKGVAAGRAAALEGPE